MSNYEPLASQLRPKTFDELIGLDYLFTEGSPLFLLRKNSKITTSLIFYGPPGVGKTTLARLIANEVDAVFVEVSATSSNISELRDIVKEATKINAFEGKETILFVDEIHRFSKTQQDFLLKPVEDGTVILIGATTENPYFSIINPLLSRSTIIEFQGHGEDSIRDLIAKVNISKGTNLELSLHAMDLLGRLSSGDLRKATSLLESLLQLGSFDITAEDITKVSVRALHRYDKDGDNHYDLISAFIKSIRGSDCDATLYYLGRLILSGEDPKFIARRLIVHAVEDIGLADPSALTSAINAMQAVNFVGLPEVGRVLAQASIHLALAPKSNSVDLAWGKALELAERNPNALIPDHLRDSHYQGAQKLGRGVGYKFPHDFPGSIVNQEYLPVDMSGSKLYFPKSNANEKKISEIIDRNSDILGKNS